MTQTLTSWTGVDFSFKIFKDTVFVLHRQKKHIF